MSSTTDNSLLHELRPAQDGKFIAITTLNAEASLNALTLPMIDALSVKLQEWKTDDRIACVLLRGAGEKAFCAGGNVVALYQSAINGDDNAQIFFTHEYRLDHAIHTYPKPIIVWGHGIVMGGGLGLMAGASHRVVTAQTRMGMPEVTIGLYPDVGGSWFLNRMPGRVGLFLALTGAALNAQDALFLGLADHAVDHTQQPTFIAALENLHWSSNLAERHAQVHDALAALAAAAAGPAGLVGAAGNVQSHYAAIQQLTAAARLAQQVETITAYAGDDAWLAKAAATLKTGCPATIRLIPELLARTKHLSLADVFRLELIVSTQCMRLGNFREGVRALLVDKDRNPKFPQATLADVSDDILMKHFAAPWGKQPHPLADL